MKQAEAEICRVLMFLKHFLLSSQLSEKASAVLEQTLGFKGAASSGSPARQQPV